MEENIYDFKRINNGDIVEGVVVLINDQEIVLDLNSYVTGIIKKNDYSFNESDFKNVKKNDKIKAIVVKVDNGEEQVAYLTRKPLIKRENLEKIKELFDSSKAFKPKKIKDVKGGAIYSYLGIEMFMPISQEALGYDSKIIEYTNDKIVISSKAVKKEIEDEEKSKEYNLINVGDNLKGNVIEILPYGLLVKFKYNVALIKISELTYDFIKNPSEVAKKNDEIEVKIIKKENGKLEASRKALLKSPFEIYKEKNSVGSKVSGKVIQKLPFGIVIELAKNVRGLLHESEYAWNPKSNFKDYIKINDELELMIIGYGNNKISLSKKALEDNPWKRVKAKKGDVVDCVVEEIESGKGIKVSTLGIEAFIGIKDLGIEKNSKIEDTYNVSDTFKALVVDVDAAKWYINLSVNRYQELLEKEEFEKYMNNNSDEEKVTLKDLFGNILK